MSDRYYQIFSVKPEDSIRDEALGTKDKFWVRRDDELWLFKESRANTGEDWSEKLAAEIAKLLKIPAATIELAECNGARGTISSSFVDRDKGQDLIHGNEILAGQVLDYDPAKQFGQSDHTLGNIQLAIQTLFPDTVESDTILMQLASYMVLDGLIGNVDRHHENWGLLARIEEKSGASEINISVAPSFDHASCLGRELLDAKIERLLALPDGVARYINKGRGAIYLSPSSLHGENPTKLVEFGSRRFPQFFNETIANVASLRLSELTTLANRIPEDRISASAIEFVKCFLDHTYKRICKLKI